MEVCGFRGIAQVASSKVDQHQTVNVPGKKIKAQEKKTDG